MALIPMTLLFICLQGHINIDDHSQELEKFNVDCSFLSVLGRWSKLSCASIPVQYYTCRLNAKS